MSNGVPKCACSSGFELHADGKTCNGEVIEGLNLGPMEMGPWGFGSGRLRPDVQPLTLSNTIFGSKSGPFNIPPVKIQPFHPDRML